MGLRAPTVDKHSIGLELGPLTAVLMLPISDIALDNPHAVRAAAVAVLMAVWWITEAVPIPATALLPVALFPLMGVMGGKYVAANCFNDVIFLFVCGFILAWAMQANGLTHTRNSLLRNVSGGLMWRFECKR